MTEPDDVNAAANSLTGAEETVFAVIQSLFAPVNNVLNACPPWSWHAAVVGLFVLTGIAVCCIPRWFIYAEAPSQSIWRDLRIWTIIALLPYIAAYSYF